MSTIQLMPEYQEYQRRVVEACVRLCGEHTREFWEVDCDFIEEFELGADPEEVAQAQFTAGRG